MAHLLRVDGSVAAACERVSMAEVGLREAEHLEPWIKAHPEVIDDSLMVVATQFGTWGSDTDSAYERPDVLALSTSGELVVIELKRDSDRRIHLQAITYGALVAGFTKELLAQVHAGWWSRGHPGEEITQAEALERLERHVEPEWSEELFRLPRLVLVAEYFPAQVLTTVQWLAAVAPDLTIECHEYQLYRQGEQLLVSFQRLFPVADLENRRLRPIVAAGTAEVREQLVTNQRRAKSVTIIHQQQLIPDGAHMTLELETLVKADLVQQVSEWLAADPVRSRITWAPDPNRPLRWAAEPGRAWTPTALRDEIFKGAGLEPPSSSAADAWCYDGQSLYSIANSAVEGA
jgi:hypothetical protein